MYNGLDNVPHHASSNANTIFQSIYDKALHAKSALELKENLIDSYLDVIKPETLPLLTPAGQLAADGYFDAAELLRQLGANVDYIALGLASKNYHEQVEKFRLEHNALVKYIIEGYIFAKNSEKISEYTLIAKNDLNNMSMARTYAMVEDEEKIKHYQSLTINLLEGYAIAGLVDKLKPYLSNADIKTINRIAAAFAISGRYNLLDSFINDYKANDYGLIIRHCIRAGNAVAVDYYCKLFKENVNFTSIAYNYAWIGNHKQVITYIQNNKVSVEDVLSVYVCKKQHSIVESLRIKFNIDPNLIAYLYAKDTQNNKVKEYRIRYKVPIQTILTAYKEAKNQSSVPKFYSTLLQLQEIPGTISISIQEQLISLTTSSSSYLNFFQKSNNHQIGQILAALDGLNNSQLLEDAFNDNNSLLYQATHSSCMFKLLKSTTALLPCPPFNLPIFANNQQPIDDNNDSQIKCKIV